MHSLYWRIVLTFWLALALILVGTVTVAVNGTLQRRFGEPWVQRGQLYAEAAQAFEAGGADGLREWLNALGPTGYLARTFVLDSSGKEMLGRQVPDFLRTPVETAAPSRDSGAAQSGAMQAGTAQAGASHKGPLRTMIRPAGGPLVLVGPDAKAYHVVVGPLRDGPHLFGELEMPTVALATLVIALVVSGVICFFLARYLVAPVDRLRHATRRMAAGDLNVRVLPELKGRQDDLCLLAADLDTMAERVRNLLESKQQLLRDVSHELRSPLARLQLALSLARRLESGVERHLDRIACEADRLEQLIARTLKLARLERPTEGLESSHVDVGELLENIVTYVGIEAEAHGCTVVVLAEDSLEVCGDPELLRSSFENVIRNAVHYTPAGSQVGIAARHTGTSVEVVVHDRGPGVPDKDLALIFEPFYRVDAARDRAVGGEGLGLAIAARAVALHGGTIEARNLQTGGLAVCITLPAASDGEHAAADASTQKKPPLRAVSDGLINVS